MFNRSNDKKEIQNFGPENNRSFHSGVWISNQEPAKNKTPRLLDEYLRLVTEHKYQ